MKKIMTIMALTIIVLGLTGCKENTPPIEEKEYLFTINDLSLTVDESQSVMYELAPAGTLADVTLAITSSSVPNVISITNLTITGLQSGTVDITATATNKEGATEEFSISTDFTVTVTGSSSNAPGVIVNGGFENELQDWTIGGPYSTYSTEVIDNNPHSGLAALNLWYDDNEDGDGEAIDLTLTQTLTDITANTYLFSLWYQGTADSITLTVLDGTTELVSETFSGIKYSAVPEHNGYVQFGIEVTLAATTDVTVQIDVEGLVNAWGYIDDIGFNQGTIDDLILAPQSDEDGYINFIDQGGFESLVGWTVDISGSATNQTGTLSSGAFSIWADGAANFDVYRDVVVEDATYNLVLYINGGVPGTEFNTSEAYMYVDDGTTIHTLDIVPEGWNNGIFKRIELLNLTLNGTVTVGVHIAFDGGGNNWINIDDFTLFSEDFEVEDNATLATAMDTAINELPSVNDVTLDNQDAIEAARAAYDALSDGAKALVTTLDTLEALEAKIQELINANITEEGYFNFIVDGDFTTVDAWSTSWTSDASNQGLELQDGVYVMWADGVGNFEMSQSLTLDPADYNLTLYINGGEYGSEFNVDEAYAYVTIGETMYTLDIEPEGWNNGAFKRIEVRGLELSGTVEVGVYIHFTSGSNNWVKLDDFTLWTLDVPVDPDDLAAATAVHDLIAALPEYAALNVDDQTNLIAARTAYDELTETQQLFVTDYLTLLRLEERMDMLVVNPLNTFNSEGTFESPDWTMEAIGWVTLGGNQWTDGDTANNGSQSYNFFKDQVTLEATIMKDVYLDTEDYTLSLYLQGGDYTSVTVIINGVDTVLTPSDAYGLFTIDFSSTGELFTIEVTVIRPDVNGWVTIDDMMIDLQS